MDCQSKTMNQTHYNESLVQLSTSTSRSTSSVSVSKSILQNNIGALMLYKGSSIPLATQRFYSSLLVAVALEKEEEEKGIRDRGCGDNNTMSTPTSTLSLRISNVISKSFKNIHDSSSSSSSRPSSGATDTAMDTATTGNCVQGLTWFHHKLFREVISRDKNQINTAAINTNTTMNRSSSTSVHRSNSGHLHDSLTTKQFKIRRDDKGEGNNNAKTITAAAVAQATVADDDDEKSSDLFMYHRYHVDENIPLGLEYMHDPICLELESIEGENHNHHGAILNTKNNNSVNHDDHYCEMNVKIAAVINIALCIWSSNRYDDNNNNNNDDDDGGDEKKIEHSDQIKWCHNRIRINKAKDALQVLQIILDHVQEQSTKNRELMTGIKVEEDQVGRRKHCLCCQQKRVAEKKKSCSSQTGSKSWANILKQSQQQQQECDDDDDDGDKLENDMKSSDSSVQMHCPDPMLLVIVHNNIGVLSFLLKKIGQAKYHFEQAKTLISSMTPENHIAERSRSSSIEVPIRTQLLLSTRYRSSSVSSSSYTSYSTTNSFSSPPSPSKLQRAKSRDHFQSLLPSLEYLNLTTILNLTRVSIRMNGEIEYAKTMSSELEDLVTSMTGSDPSLLGASSMRSVYQYQKCRRSASATPYQQQHRIKWLITVSMNYIPGLLQQRLEHHTQSLEYYNTMLSSTRKELGHNHIFVALILEKKGNVLFEQRKYQTAMLSYLASLRIYEHQSMPFPSPRNLKILNCNGFQLEQSKLLYSIGRTLHDREEFSDALSMYQKALSLLQQEQSLQSQGNESVQNRSILVESIQIMVLIGRVHQIMGDLEQSLNVNLEIVDLASAMVGAVSSNYSDDENSVLHPFVRNRLVVVGNVYVEMGRLNDAMHIFARVARGSGDEGTDWMVGHLRPEMEDVDTSAFAVQAAERLGELGANNFKPHAAAA